MAMKKAASFDAFKAFTLAVAAGTRKVDPDEPKIWFEPTNAMDVGSSAPCDPDDAPGVD